MYNCRFIVDFPEINLSEQVTSHYYNGSRYYAKSVIYLTYLRYLSMITHAVYGSISKKGLRDTKASTNRSSIILGFV